MSRIEEKPFGMLRKSDGQPFSEETVKNWYIARSFVLEQLAKMEEKIAITPNSNNHLHVVVRGDHARMLAIVRQVALFAHYVNFDEENEDVTKKNRTVITIVSHDPDIREKLMAEEYLCNLPKYCAFKYNDSYTLNMDSFIDIEIHVVKDYPEDSQEAALLSVCQEMVDTYWYKRQQEHFDAIDTRMAFFTDKVYHIGETIDNLPSEDIHCAKRYAMALKVFRHQKLTITPENIFSDNDSQAVIREKLSNIFCSDCFKSRQRSVMAYSEEKKRNGEQVKRLDDLWEDMNNALSRSEHARWVVEKLIMGYSPLSSQQRMRDEDLSYDAKKRSQYRKELKRDIRQLAHIDLCSYRDLRRINPDNMKYDSFLMLAIPRILERMKREGES